MKTLIRVTKFTDGIRNVRKLVALDNTLTGRPKTGDETIENILDSLVEVYKVRAEVWS